METMVSLAHFLRHRQYKHVLLLVNPQAKAVLLKDWEQESIDGCKLSELFSITSLPQNAQDAQICMVSVFDIQMQIGIERKLPFFKMFDVVVLGDDVSTKHGPVWHQVVEIFTIASIRVFQVHALLPEESME